MLNHGNVILNKEESLFSEVRNRFQTYLENGHLSADCLTVPFGCTLVRYSQITYHIRSFLIWYSAGFAVPLVEEKSHDLRASCMPS